MARCRSGERPGCGGRAVYPACPTSAAIAPATNDLPLAMAGPRRDHACRRSLRPRTAQNHPGPCLAGVRTAARTGRQAAADRFGAGRDRAPSSSRPAAIWCTHPLAGPARPSGSPSAARASGEHRARRRRAEAQRHAGRRPADRGIAAEILDLRGQGGRQDGERRADHPQRQPEHGRAAQFRHLPDRLDLRHCTTPSSART